MEYRAKPGKGVWLTVFVVVAAFALALWGIEYSLDPEDRVLKIMLLAPTYLFMAIFAFLAVGAFNLSYRVGEKGLSLQWGAYTKVVPWKEITHVIKVVGKCNLCSIIGADWPGYQVGIYIAKGLGPIRLYATYPDEGFIYIKSNVGFFGITPPAEMYEEMLQYIAQHAGKEIEVIDMDEIPEELKGQSEKDDYTFRLLKSINVWMLLAYGIYLLVFFPGSGAPKLVILLLVLAIGLFFFNTSNAARLYQFSPGGGYAILALGIMVNGIFFIVSFGEITLK
ncbi:MAG TPA: hypothetical protein DER60_07780 [Syntrophomonas sp.]|jgi:hypothetical protein|nr:hypothetical protein [Syntrophomonas sp.]